MEPTGVGYGDHLAGGRWLYGPGGAVHACGQGGAPANGVARALAAEIVAAAGLPGSKVIPATSYLLSFLALKLLGTERYAHVGDHAFDPGLGMFAGLNVLPKYSSSQLR